MPAGAEKILSKPELKKKMEEQVNDFDDDETEEEEEEEVEDDEVEDDEVEKEEEDEEEQDDEEEDEEEEEKEKEQEEEKKEKGVVKGKGEKHKENNYVDENANLALTTKKKLLDLGQTKTRTKPSTAVMVTKALVDLNEKSGSSVYAITKYIMNNYKDVDEKRTKLLIYKYLKKSVSQGKVIQLKRSFKIVEEKDKSKKPIKPKKTETTKKTNEKNSANVKGKLNGKPSKNVAAIAKEKKPKKPANAVEPSLSKDLMKTQKPKLQKPSKATKEPKPSSSSSSSSAKAAGRGKIKSARKSIYNERLSLIPVKLAKYKKLKLTTKEKELEIPLMSSTPKEVPKNSKEQKIKNPKTKLQTQKTK